MQMNEDQKCKLVFRLGSALGLLDKFIHNEEFNLSELNRIRKLLIDCSNIALDKDYKKGLLD